MEIIELNNACETEECLPQIRWLHHVTVREDKKLQQAWRITLREKGGRAMGSRIEWRDVPLAMSP